MQWTFYTPLNLRQVKMRSATTECIAEFFLQLNLKFQSSRRKFLLQMQLYQYKNLLAVREKLKRGSLISSQSLSLLGRRLFFILHLPLSSSQPSVRSDLSSSVGRVGPIFRLFRPILGRPVFFSTHFGSVGPIMMPAPHSCLVLPSR